MIVVQLANNQSHSQDPPLDLNTSQLNADIQISVFPPTYTPRKCTMPLRFPDWVRNIVLMEELKQTQNFTWET